MPSYKEKNLDLKHALETGASRVGALRGMSDRQRGGMETIYGELFMAIKTIALHEPCDSIPPKEYMSPDGPVATGVGTTEIETHTRHYLRTSATEISELRDLVELMLSDMNTLSSLVRELEFSTSTSVGPTLSDCSSAPLTATTEELEARLMSSYAARQSEGLSKLTPKSSSDS